MNAKKGQVDDGDQSAAIADSMYRKDWFSQWLGIKRQKVAPGYVVLEMRVRREMLNGFGILHGGVSFSLADSALAFAANGYGQISVSMEASLSFIRSAAEGDIIRAEAREISKTNRIGVYEVIITNQKSEQLGHFKGTVYRTSKVHESA